MWYNRIAERGYSSVVERHLPKVNVRGSNPLTRSLLFSRTVLLSLTLRVPVMAPQGITTAFARDRYADAADEAAGKGTG